MRIFVYLTLALAGLVVVTDTASAGIFGRKGGGNCCGGSYGATYGGTYTYPPTYGMYPNSPCCGGSVATYPSQWYYSGYPTTWSSAYPGTWSTAGSSWLPSGAMITSGTTMTTNGMGNVIQTTDGKYYVRGADGSYYAAPNGVTTTSGYTPSYSAYPGTYYTNPGVYQAGYPGTYYPGYPGVIQTGGTQLQAMPGVTLPGGVTVNPGGVTIPQPMPNK